jgi:predicted dehydrogenase
VSAVKRVRIAVVGAGNWGRNHVRTVASLPEATLAAVCDLDPARLQGVERLYPTTRATAVLSEALDVADAVVVACPAAAHAPVARADIERGLPVLVEKPFALSADEAESVALLADAKRVPVMAGHLLLFHPAIERLKEMIHAGDLGQLYYLYSQRVNLGQVRPDENALWSFGPH